MALLNADCPRCHTSHTTFNVLAQKSRGIVYAGWVEAFELFSVCKRCHVGTIFNFNNKNYENRAHWADPQGILNYGGYINDFGEITGYVSLKDQDAEPAPEYTPDAIAAVYIEATTCCSVRCYNAAAAMFRSTIDIATKSLMPTEEGSEPSAHIRKSLGLRLRWLFDNRHLPEELRKMAECVQQDGNDGVHDANLNKATAEDLKDFTFHLLERMFTLPKRIELAEERRRERRSPPEMV